MVDEKPPAFQFYVKEWRSSRAVQRMTFAQRGMYLEMLVEQWDKGSLPDHVPSICDLLGGDVEEWHEAWPVLRRKFVDRRYKPRHDDPEVHDPGDQDPLRRIVNLRLEKCRKEWAAYKERRSKAGRLGGAANARKVKQLSGKQSLTVVEQSLTTVKQSSTIVKPAPAPASSPPPAPASARTDAPANRVQAFVDWYGQAHERYTGVGYIGNPQTDYQRAIDLCQKFSDQDLQDAAMVWFAQDDDWIRSGTRTIGRFASRASRCLEEAKAKLARQRMA